MALLEGESDTAAEGPAQKRGIQRATGESIFGDHAACFRVEQEQGHTFRFLCIHHIRAGNGAGVHAAGFHQFIPAQFAGLYQVGVERGQEEVISTCC